ncbi:heme-degrading monooxygenase HmoA [Catenulispora sp. GAS73]|uniref:antibiotic biosynthesis monooxygenase family protein n=1 Tax=Catenulispora sp. GAS73 TaxID=3156269 RepID=UPI003515CE3A
MTTTIRVMVHAKVPDRDFTAFETEYKKVTDRVKGTPGHIRDELLRATDASDSIILLSEWESREKFLAWEDAPIHRQTTGGLRPYWSGGIARIIYEVTPGA